MVESKSGRQPQEISVCSDEDLTVRELVKDLHHLGFYQGGTLGFRKVFFSEIFFAMFFFMIYELIYLRFEFPSKAKRSCTSVHSTRRLTLSRVVPIFPIKSAS